MSRFISYDKVSPYSSAFECVNTKFQPTTIDMNHIVSVRRKSKDITIVTLTEVIYAVAVPYETFLKNLEIASLCRGPVYRADVDPTKPSEFHA